MLGLETSQRLGRRFGKLFESWMCGVVEDVRTLSCNDDFLTRIEQMKKVIELVQGDAIQRDAA